MRSVLLTTSALILLTATAATAQDKLSAPVRAGTPRWLQLRLHGMLHLSPRPAHRTAPTTPSLTFTFFDYPGTSYTIFGGINLGASPHAKQYDVGVYGPGLNGSGSFLGGRLELTMRKGAISETYTQVLPTVTNVDPFGINDQGDIVGVSGPSSSTGFLLKHGAVTTIAAPYDGVNVTFANSINNNGIIVGAYSTTNGAEFGFTWYKGVYTQIAPYPGATQTWPWSINNKGDQAGYVDDSLGNTHGFLLVGGTYTLLDYPGAAYTIATGVNDSDQVVGIYCVTVDDCTVPNNFANGFLYDGGTYTPIDVPGTSTNYPSNINNSGIIAGNYTDTNGFDHSYLATQ